MRRLASILLVVSLAFTVGGCAAELAKLKAGYQAAQNAIMSPLAGEIAPKAALAAVSTFDGLEVIATRWWRLPRCTGTNGPLCRDPAYGDRIDAAVMSGRSARNNIKAFIKDHRGAAVPSTLYDVIIAANTTINEATAAYRAALGN